MATKERYSYMKTLNEILAEHPEFGDVPIGIYTGGDIGYDYAPLIYISEPNEEELADFRDDEYGGPTLVFSAD
jgi:hypothetical protein